MNIVNLIENISKTYNIDVKNIIKNYLNYIIINKSSYINKKFIDFIEQITHLTDINVNYFKTYTAISLNNLFTISEAIL